MGASNERRGRISWCVVLVEFINTAQKVAREELGLVTKKHVLVVNTIPRLMIRTLYIVGNVILVSQSTQALVLVDCIFPGISTIFFVV